MYVDSHCHLSFPELQEDLPGVLARMREARVDAALNVCTTLPEFPSVLAVAGQAGNLFASVGVHPDYTETPEPTVKQLVELARHPKVVAIGETGLDYYRLGGRTARVAAGPVPGPYPRCAGVRQAADHPHARCRRGTRSGIMREEGADQAGGVMHCFTESLEVAPEAAMDPRLPHLGLGNRDLQECAGPARGRPGGAAGPHADRDRRPLPRPGAPPRPAQRAVVRAARRRPAGRAAWCGRLVAEQTSGKFLPSFQCSL